MDEQLPVVSEIWDQNLADQVRAKIGPSLRGSKAKINKEHYLQDVHGTFFAIGGHARLAHEANAKPRWFYDKYLRPGILLPDQHETLDVNFHIHPALARTPLDGEFTDGELDSGGDQAPGSPAPRIGGPAGTDDTTEEDGAGPPLGL